MGNGLEQPETGFLTVSIPKSADERRAKHYAEIREEAVQQVKIKKMLCQMKRDRICCLITVTRGSL